MWNVVKEGTRADESFKSIISLRSSSSVVGALARKWASAIDWALSHRVCSLVAPGMRLQVAVSVLSHADAFFKRISIYPWIDESVGSCVMCIWTGRGWLMVAVSGTRTSRSKPAFWIVNFR